MLEQVKATIRKHSMFNPKDRVLAGVSGGPDSVAMVHVLKTLARDLQIEVFIAHLNHGLRGGESDQDAEFVRKLAAELQLTAVVEKRDVEGYALGSKLSLQTAAREVRYRFFSDAAKRLGCNKLATGHNANDQAETLLFNFLRGTGPSGLKGIPPVRDGWITRPLIEVGRSLTEQYCRDNGLVTRLDKSNLKTVYTRNKLRLELIPLLEKEYNENIVETLARTSDIFREEEEYFDGLTREYWDQVCRDQGKGKISFDMDRFSPLPPVIQKRIIRRAWETLSGNDHSLGYIHLVKTIDFMRDADNGARMDLPGDITVAKNYDVLSFLAGYTGDDETAVYSHEIMVPGITLIPETGDAIFAEVVAGGWSAAEMPEPDEAFVDLDRISPPLKVRSRRPGDSFKPTGFHGTKKLKKFFIDNKVPRTERGGIPLIVTGDDHIVWIAGERSDRRWQPGPESKRILKLKFMRKVTKQN
ncbi:MAG: tRNA lysidine(34) synthetase TilS [Firmicutes bacterium HGW-Firmicutes-14]|nr:MAG: tRNA lysidine(34) synthetase TilS [Firmicutes bacterium HGW-Firmicutes-14]